LGDLALANRPAFGLQPPLLKTAQAEDGLFFGRVPAARNGREKSSAAK